MAEVPGTTVKVEMCCKKFKGHDGHHVAKGTMNGVEFEVEYETTEKI